MIKKVDERIRTLIENCVKAHHRSIVIIGDKSPDQSEFASYVEQIDGQVKSDRVVVL
ncbi:hypothetical protein OROGR_000750 [Orobanche gracilis]